MRRIAVLGALALAFPALAGEICLDREANFREQLPGALFAWEYHVYVDHDEMGSWSRLRPNQVRDVLVDAGWKSLDNRELLRVSKVLVESAGLLKGIDQGCGVKLAARGVGMPPAGDVIWDVTLVSRGEPHVNGICEPDCFGH